MNEQQLSVPTRFGVMPTFTFSPDGLGRYPAVIMYMDGAGIREVLMNLARRVAREGFFVFVPDLYYRLGTIRFNIARRTDPLFFDQGPLLPNGRCPEAGLTQRDDFTAVMRHCEDHLTNELVMDDTAAIFNVLDGQDRITPGPVGCVGFCFSGRFIVSAAARYSHRVAGAATLYGTGIITPRDDSAHLLLEKVKAEMYFGFAASDPTVPDDVVSLLRAQLKDAGVKHNVEVYPAAHGFSFADRADYCSAAADEAWAKVLDLLARSLA
jgi:carboxymethylenebutenolidase